MIIDLLIAVIGLIILVKGSGFFIASVSTLAKKLGVSEFVIGLTIVAFGTSIPELASAIIASIKGEGGIIIGNITGANIGNIGLIIGISAIIATIKTDEKMLKRDGYIMLSTAIVFLFFIFNKHLSRIEGIAFLLLYIAYIVFLFESKETNNNRYQFKEFVSYFFKFKYLRTIKNGISSRINGNGKKSVRNNRSKKKLNVPIKFDILITILSGFAIFYGASLVIGKAIFFAEIFQIPSLFLGVILALGTTLPELSVSLTAAKKGLGNIAIGNIIGSNITNVLLILGISSLINPISISKLTLFYAVPYMIFMSILLLAFLKTNWSIKKFEGIALIFFYLVFVLLLLFNVVK